MIPNKSNSEKKITVFSKSLLFHHYSENRVWVQDASLLGEACIGCLWLDNLGAQGPEVLFILTVVEGALSEYQIQKEIPNVLHFGWFCSETKRVISTKAQIRLYSLNKSPERFLLNIGFGAAFPKHLQAHRAALKTI